MYENYIIWSAHRQLKYHSPQAETDFLFMFNWFSLSCTLQFPLWTPEKKALPEMKYHRCILFVFTCNKAPACVVSIPSEPTTGVDTPKNSSQRIFILSLSLDASVWIYGRCARIFMRVARNWMLCNKLIFISLCCGARPINGPTEILWLYQHSVFFFLCCLMLMVSLLLLLYRYFTVP